MGFPDAISAPAISPGQLPVNIIDLPPVDYPLPNASNEHGGGFPHWCGSRTMKYLLVTVLTAFLFSDSFGRESVAIESNEIDMLAFASRSKAGDTDVKIYLINRGSNAIKVPTGGMHVSLRMRGGARELIIKVAFRFNEIWGKELIIPESELAPVTLLPGEVTVTQVAIRIPEEDFPTEQIQIVYTVEKNVSSRYNYWKGSVKKNIVDAYNERRAWIEAEFFSPKSERADISTSPASR